MYTDNELTTILFALRDRRDTLLNLKEDDAETATDIRELEILIIKVRGALPDDKGLTIDEILNGAKAD